MPLTRTALHAMSEAAVRQQVLIPLFKAMKYQDVREYHGPREHGKDIVMWRMNDLGVRDDYAVVVKKGNLSGKAAGRRGSAQDVTFQVRQALRSEFFDTVSNRRHRPRHCIVVASGTIPESARAAIEAGMAGEFVGAVRFIDGDKLWELVQEYLPASAVWQSLIDAQAIFENASEHYRIVPMLGKDAVSLTVEPKHPGAPEAEPLVFQGTFAFPDTPEGREALNSFRRHLETGAPVTVTQSYIQSFSTPEFLKPFLDPKGAGFAEVRLGPQSLSQPVVMSISMQAGSEAAVSHDRVHFQVVQAGTDEATFDSEAEGAPWRIRLLINLRSKMMTLRHGLGLAGANAKAAFQGARFMRALCRGGVFRMVDPDSGLLLASANLPVGLAGEWTESRDKWLTVFERLALIQEKSGVLLRIPDCGLTTADAEAILRTAHVIETGRMKVDPSSAMVQHGRKKAEELLGSLSQDSPETLVFVGDHQATANILGTAVPLGRTAILVNGYELDPEVTASTQARLADPAEDGPFDVRFNPTSSAAVQQIYERWLPSEDRQLIPADLFESGDF